MTSEERDQSRKEQRDECKDVVTAEPADRCRAEQLRAMVTTPEPLHDERIGASSPVAAHATTIDAEKLLLAERLAVTESIFDPADQVSNVLPPWDVHEGFGDDQPGTSTLPDPSTLYDDQTGGDD